MSESIYHVSYRTEGSYPLTLSSFVLAKDLDDLRSKLVREVGNIVEVESMASVSVSDILGNLEDDDLLAVIPEYKQQKLRKKVFLRNLLYTKDYLVEDLKDKKKLHNIISKL